MKTVISLGGSVIGEAVENGELDRYVTAFTELAEDCDTLVIVTGAGPLKTYINTLDDDVSEARKDIVGISATRLHAATLAAGLGANVTIPDQLTDVAEMAMSRDVIVLGGLIPGQSTDGVAAECAELLDADRLVLATTVDGVYDTDPHENDDATRFDELSADDLVELVRGQESTAGSYQLIDLVAAKLIQRSELETVVLDGRDTATLKTALDTDPAGTRIV